MPRYCQNCGAQLSQDDAFCGECGEAVAGQDAADGPGEPARGQESTPPGDPDAGHGGADSREPQGESRHTGQQRQGRHGAGQTGRAPDRRQRGDQYGGAGQRRTGRGAKGPAREDLPRPPRKNALDTFQEAVSWVVDAPIIFGAFLVVGLLDFLGGQIFPLLGLASLILSLLVWGAAYHYTVRYLQGTRIDGTVDEISDMITTVSDRLVSLIGIGIVYAIAVFIGLILLIIPGIYIGGRLILAFPACVLDGKNMSDSLSTSWEIADGNVMKLVGIFLINVLAIAGIGVILGVMGIASTGSLSGTGFVVSLITVPISAFLGAAVQMAVGRVYLENRFAPGHQNVPPQQQSHGREPPRDNQTDW